MRRSGHRIPAGRRCTKRVLLATLAAGAIAFSGSAQQQPEAVARKLEQLTEAMARTQAQIDQSQRDLNQLRIQIAGLRQQLAANAASPATPVTPSSTQAASPQVDAALDDLRERQSMVESQIATHDQIKVESESRYPVKVTGLLLFNGFVNTNQVDMPATPTVATGGSGNTGASVRQTILGFDARGPHLFGAESSADLRVDFSGNGGSANSAASYAGLYGANAPALRLRTAHAALAWNRTQAFFSLDRPIVSSQTATSLTAVAEPEFSWSGNLWTWNPQLGVAHDVAAGARILRLQGALIDVGDAPVLPVAPPPSGASTAEQSRWPGAEAEISLLGNSGAEVEDHLGVGGYFAPHTTATGFHYDSWASTLDAHVRLPARFSLSASAYRGLGLGGLGGGAYKDYVSRLDPDTGGYYHRVLDDVGGWAQLKQTLNSRLEFNAGLGLDEVFAGQLRRYAAAQGSSWQNLARNRTYTGNVIFRPSAYLLFSIEYRLLESATVIGAPATSNVIGIAAGYKF